MDRKPTKKDIAKAYGKYAKGFTPKPNYFRNTLRAFVVMLRIACITIVRPIVWQVRSP